jgi:hypothetical protein
MFDIFYTGTKPNLFPHEQATDSIEHAQQLSRTRYFWWINYLTDYTGFDFLWEPTPWESHQRHAWPSQWQKDSGTYLIPKLGYLETNYRTDQKLTRLPSKDNWNIPEGFDLDLFEWSWHPDPADPPYRYQFGTQHQRTGGPQYLVLDATELKFVDQLRGNVKTGHTPIIEIDHLDGYAGKVPNTVKTVRYFDNYKDTLTRIANTVEHEYVWIVSSVCNYDTFDFSWHPEIWQSTMLHVFASDGEKFGDTFFMHVPTFQYRAEKCQLLEWYDLNFMDRSVPRRPLPLITHNNDSHVNAIKNTDWQGPLAVFSTGTLPAVVPAVPLWREKTKTVVPLSSDASNLIVPKVAVPYIKTQVYDYPYIDKTKKHLNQDTLQDVVFISYDEPDADQNWEMLIAQCPRAVRIHGVKGMETALEAAADVATTPWYFAVFAKTKIYETFDFSYVPDYMQQPKHYIFNCLNIVNDLEYGHMGIVMYNSASIRQVNRQKDFGLDYTLSAPHESVPLLSCYGLFNQSPYHTWRTAFRESAKLAYFESIAPSVEGAYRLNIWKTHAHGNYAEWCLQGAKDGVEFFATTQGSLDRLKLSFRWEWLRNYFEQRYGNLQ